MLQIFLDILVSIFAVFGFYHLCLNFYGFLLHWKNNYHFKAQLYIQLDNSMPMEYILKTFSFIRERYFPNMKITISGNFSIKENTDKIDTESHSKIISAK